MERRGDEIEARKRNEKESKQTDKKGNRVKQEEERREENKGAIKK